MSDRFTRQDYMALPEGFPAQLIEGCLVKEPSPAPSHQRVLSRLHYLLASRIGPDRVLASPVDVVVDEHNVYQPDLVVLANVLAPDARDVGTPLVAVEVLSPSTRRRDREVKAGRLLAAGVEEVWILDPRERAIELRRGADVRTARDAERIRSRALPEALLVPRALFA